MSVTITKVSGPSISPKGFEFVFSLLLDSSHAAGGEELDLTSYLSTLVGAHIGGVDAIADAVWTYEVAGPGRTTALTSSNVLLTAHHGSGADAVNNPADAEDLSGVGALIITVWGKAAAVSSWA